MSDASTPNFSFNHLILFSRYSCAWGNLPGTIRALRTKVTAIGTSSHVVLFDETAYSLRCGWRIDPCQRAFILVPVSDAIPLHVMWPSTPAGRRHLAERCRTAHVA